MVADGSVHRAAWPLAADLDTRAETQAEVFDAAAAVLREVRKAKTMARKACGPRCSGSKSMATQDYLAAVRAAADDLRAAGSVQELVLTEAGDDRVLVELA